MKDVCRAETTKVLPGRGDGNVKRPLQKGLPAGAFGRCGTKAEKKGFRGR